MTLFQILFQWSFYSQINEAIKFQITALYVAVELENIDIINLLLSYPSININDLSIPNISKLIIFF